MKLHQTFLIKNLRNLIILVLVDSTKPIIGNLLRK